MIVVHQDYIVRAQKKDFLYYLLKLLKKYVTFKTLSTRLAVKKQNKKRRKNRRNDEDNEFKSVTLFFILFSVIVPFIFLI